MKSNYLFTMIVVFSLFLIMGCSNFNEKRTGYKDGEFPPSYSGIILIDATLYQMEKGGYRWERKNGSVTETVLADHASPNQMAERMESIRTMPNQKVDIKIEGNPTIKVNLWNEEGIEKEIEQDANQIVVPSSKGKYIYEVVADYPNGTMSYVFVIEVQ